ncbi:M23 family metallopeptidase [Hymenobacter sp. BRD128]|uniref:M23 family metallopeptidase n=1 Tax=Hymenobacter sp. BRD128 TaxID=2675878 RepID=UPI001564E16E|nr:M23 family metallopeptidase [Hymenobacter sp. BRD128]QKG57104.1 M23 family metallopeptidase [Hymenobacter sp. BRD128]
MLNTKLLRQLSLSALGGLLLLATSGHGQDDGQDDTTTRRVSGPIKPAVAPGKVEVAPGYFLFPIAPGQPGFLAASMGELRPNHFHGGLDIKTGGGVNKPVYAAADGYISRLKQSAFGYGNVLYITHPNGLTTVYGHLNKFEGAVAAELLHRQYEKQTYELELFFQPGQFPVKRGEQVALSGNTGGSAGPHVHWEVRDAQDRQLNPLQWGGFAEIQDHTGPTLQALAVEPLAITARVRGRFERAVLVPRLQPLPGANTVWPDTVRCFGQVGLLLQGFDRFDNAWNKNGIQRVTVRVNGQPHYQHIIDAVPFPNGTRQVNNFVDYAYAHTSGRTLQKLWVEDGDDLPFYTPAGLGQGKLDVQDGQVYRIDFELADSYNNKATAHLVLRGEKPTDYAKLPGAAAPGRSKLTYDITRNLLRATALNAPTDTAGQPQYLLLRRGGRQLALRPSYSVGAATTYLYDLRAGLPDSLLLGSLHQAFDRQVMIAPGQETNYATPYVNVAFGSQTLFSNLYLSTVHRADASPLAPESWTVGTALVPLYLPLRLTLKPASPPADHARTAIYSVSANGGRAYVGGTWNEAGTQISANLKQFGQFRLYTDTKAPSAQLVGRAGGQLTFRVGDDMSGLATYKLLVGGRFRLLRYEYKNATLFTVAGDTLGPKLRGPAELHLADQAGNEKVIPLSL